jgi:transporter family-2 protein
MFKMYMFSLLMALLSGLLISVHGIVNSMGSKTIGLPAMLAMYSIVQAIPPLLFILFRQQGNGIGQVIAHGLKWYLLSGIIGMIIVTALTFSITQIGSLTAFVIVVLGQVIGAAIADHFGLFGVPIKPVNTLRIVSILIIMIGVGLLIKSEPAQSDNEVGQAHFSMNESGDIS